jgi:AraC-like DNA-binding protein
VREAFNGPNPCRQIDVRSCAGTSNYAGVDQFEAFSQLVSERTVPMDICLGDADGFKGRLRSANLGVVQLFELWTCNSFVARRTGGLITSSSPDYLKVCVQLAGFGVVSQEGRRAALGPGDFALYDTTRPYQIASAGPYHMQSVMFSRGTLRLSPMELERLMSQRISGHDGIGSLVAPFLVDLFRTVRASVPRRCYHHHLADAMLDLLSASFAERLGDAHTIDTSTSRADLLHRVRTYVERQLGDPDLDVSKIAAAQHVSVRTLQRIFGAQEQTLTGWIRTRRIEHCRKDLENPSLAGRSVKSIAAEWGLLDPAHFSRLFKAAYGASPRDYRVKTLGQLRRI